MAYWRFLLAWARSSVGRARESHSRGQGFESPRVHQTEARRRIRDTRQMRVRDDRLHPDPGFAELYAALPDAEDLSPWLEWCRAAKPPVLYLGIGTGRLATPLHSKGIELVGVDAHPGMLASLHARAPDIETH